MTAETIARLCITLEDIHPAIWRREGESQTIRDKHWR